ncbi:FAD-binding protein [Bifidobacterium amazonense]|uniref:FAD-binding protein n=1 Tax=Bifidobacterium amazonense TaxID=2809027 RepID=A0ABS9VZ78_9BIFI|nr:FAD-linked oxidase C-terminal domain-containing protein [Bifidobacterium amazonense]MCH9277191.1 FAD-binding protein [Bifidobacterium amazonense]
MTTLTWEQADTAVTAEERPGKVAGVGAPATEATAAEASAAETLRDALRDILPDPLVIVDPASIDGIQRRSRQDGVGPIIAAVTPDNAQQIADVLRLASAARVPVYTRGAGSGIGGLSAPERAGILLLTERLNRILDFDPVSRTIRVEAGVVTADINAYLDGSGLYYAPDPASAGFSTIGGNIATNAGGFHCVKYGTTRQSLLSLKVVLADGSIIETGRGVAKNVAGLDLTSLFTGSEGALGVVVEATLKLLPRPLREASAIAFLDDLAQVGDAVNAVQAVPVQVSTFDLMGVPYIQTYPDRYLPAVGDARWMLLVQADGLAGDEEIRLVAEALRRVGASVITPDGDEVASFLELRTTGRAIPPSDHPRWLVEVDAAVPLSQVATYLRDIEGEARAHAGEGVGFSFAAHIGDGNVHAVFLAERRPDDVDRPESITAIRHRLLLRALELGGTITGEHGIGTGLKDYLPLQVGERDLAVQRAIKQALDPQGILNPGKWL